jgi:hypothetical protein
MHIFNSKTKLSIRFAFTILFQITKTHPNSAPLERIGSIFLKKEQKCIDVSTQEVAQHHVVSAKSAGVDTKITVWMNFSLGATVPWGQFDFSRNQMDRLFLTFFVCATSRLFTQFCVVSTVKTRNIFENTAAIERSYAHGERASILTQKMAFANCPSHPRGCVTQKESLFFPSFFKQVNFSR